MKELTGWPKKVHSLGLMTTATGFLLMVTQQFWANALPAFLRVPLVILAALTAVTGLILVTFAERTKRRKAR